MLEYHFPRIKKKKKRFIFLTHLFRTLGPPFGRPRLVAWAPRLRSLVPRLRSRSASSLLRLLASLDNPPRSLRSSYFHYFTRLFKSSFCFFDLAGIFFFSYSSLSHFFFVILIVLISMKFPNYLTAH